MQVRSALKRLFAAALVATVGILVAGLIVLPRLHTFSYARSLLPYPVEWDGIRPGDSFAAVTAKCPEKHQEVFKRKGRGLYYDRHLYGFWSMEVVYNADDRVELKRFRLRIGTRDFYKDYFHN